MNSTATKEKTTHILPKKLYFTIGLALLVLTSITVWVATFDFGPWNLVVALSVAALKAALVVLFFMHLYYDNKIYAVILSSSLLILAIFIILIMFDTGSRGAVYTQVEKPINPHAMIYDASGKVLDLNAPSDLNETDFEFLHGFGPVKEKLILEDINAELAAQGSEIFDTKCGACHRLNERLVGPPLAEVTKRRTPEFVLNMILSPDEMLANHPVTKKLLAEYYTKMTFQNVSRDQARAILEFLRLEGEKSESGDSQ